MDPMTAMVVGQIAGKVVGKVAGYLIPVSDPWETYQKKVPWIRSAKAPGYLTPDEIRGMAGKVKTSAAAVTNTAALSRSVSAGRAGTASHDRAGMIMVSEQLHSVNSMLKIRDAVEKAQRSAGVLEASAKSAELQSEFKKGLMDYYATGALQKYEDDMARRGTFSSLVGSGAGLLTAAGLAGGWKNLFGNGAPGGPPPAQGAFVGPPTPPSGTLTSPVKVPEIKIRK